MRVDQYGRSAYVLEKTYSGQMDWSLFFVYSRREHIRALLRDMFLDNPDPVEGQASSHDSGESADLWVIEHGRRTGHVDLCPFIQEMIEAEDDLDWSAFDAAVPATVAGTALRHGEQLRLPNVEADFRHVTSALPELYPDHPVRYGMQVWVDDEMSDQPYEVFTDPDPANTPPESPSP